MFLRDSSYYVHNTLDLWVSTFLILQLLNTVSHVVVNPNHKIISLLLHNCNFATVVNHNVNILYAGYLICNSPKVVMVHRLRITVLDYDSDFEKERNPVMCSNKITRRT